LSKSFSPIPSKRWSKPAHNGDRLAASHARTGWQTTDWSDEFMVDVRLADAKADDFDTFLLPGGVMNSRQATPTASACDSMAVPHFIQVIADT
jgi:hypothetical protein